VGVVNDRLRLVRGGAAAESVPALSIDPVLFQDSCLRAFEASQVARGFAQTTMDNGSGTLDRFLAACGRPAWEVTREDVDRVVAGLVAQGLSAATRRGYVQTFKGFHAFLSARKAAEIEAAFGVRMLDPVDGFNAARHVDAGSPSTVAPPGPQRMEDFFDFLKDRIAGARKYAAAGRDYALFRTLYLAGLRAEESASLDRADVHFGRGPFGKLHVRFGKGAKTSGPRPRWVPMLDGLDLILRWYLEEIAPRLGEGPALFCDEGGGRIHRGTIRNRLAYLLELEAVAHGAVDGPAGLAPTRFSPHMLRHACATRNYERGVDLVAIQQMLGHWHVGTTMRYVTPSATFIEDAYRRAVSGTLADLEGDRGAD
jgi:site-specific recombinase XerD